MSCQVTSQVYIYRDYQATLEVVCEKGSRDKYGLLNWTVAEETDDIVYYHSYTHEVRSEIFSIVPTVSVPRPEIWDT